MGIIIIILIVTIFEKIQIMVAHKKIVKWIQPIIVFLFSVKFMRFCIIFEKYDYMNAGKSISEIFDSGMVIQMIIVFFILNIPTIMFLITNKIVNKRKMENENNKVELN